MDSMIRSLIYQDRGKTGEALDLDRTKAVELGILDAFDDWCAKHGLTWWLTYGTLLGAVRHQGFIPWDDDIDLMMPYDDFMRMIELVNSGQTMPEPFLLSSNKVRNAISDIYPHAKVFDMRTKAVQHELRTSLGIDEGVWIDVFPLIGVFADPTERHRYANGTYRSFLMASQCNWKSIFGCSPVATLNKVLILRRALIYPYACLRGHRHWLRKHDRLISEHPNLNDSAQCVIPPCNSSLFETKDFAESIELEFEGKNYPAPAGYDAILRVEYGDYMQPPPPEQRLRLHDFDATWR